MFKKLTFIDSSNPELPLDRGDERWALEHCSSERLERPGDLGSVGHGRVEAGDADILFSGALLRFHEAGCAVDTYDEVSGDFGVKGAAVAGLFRT